MKKTLVLMMLGSAVIGLNGCASYHTQLIENRHWELNDAIRETHLEQLLLNIVRLRYDETPFFLQLSSISTSFSSSVGVGASGEFPDGGTNVLGLNGSLSYTESPTVTWSLPDSRQYLGLLMAPMGADQLTVLAQSGWDPGLVLKVGVKKMNRLRGLEFNVNQGIYQPANYEQFLEVLRLLDELNREGLIDLAYGVKSSRVSTNIPLEQFDITVIPDALAHGVQFMPRDDPKVLEPLKLFKPLFLRFSRQSDNDPRAKRIRELLNLDADKYSFGIVDTGNSSVEQLRAESGKLTQAFDPDTEYAEIVLNNRSVMEILYFASRFVEVPETDLMQKRVSADSQRPDTDWFKILSSASEPTDAWLKVKYRDSWFYIAATDVQSRSSFTLLNAIFASVVGNIPGAEPLLTLPVK